MVTDRLCSLLGTAFRKPWFRPYRLAEGKTNGGHLIHIIQPLTYMNRTGAVVPAVLKKCKCSPEDMLIVCDNLDLPIGSIRFKKQGSSAGHRGLSSIIDAAGTNKFMRLYLGIGRPERKEDVVSYVLSPFNENEQPVCADMVAEAAEKVLSIICEFDRRI